MTWFCAKDYVHWLDADRDGALLPRQELISSAQELVTRFLQAKSN
jgi:hypothetical protein